MMTTTETVAQQIDTLSAKLESKVIDWRRDFHAHPELSNREFETSKKVAAHLSKLGFEVKTNVAHTGVVGILKGGKPGKTVALRADMDALPVSEEVDLPFASKVKTTYEGQEVGVMHACGHDAHTAILMGVAEVLAGVREQIKGTVKFFFQPAEEGPPTGEKGGAALMIEEGVMENPRPDAIFGLHVIAGIETGHIGYRIGPILASGDMVYVDITGKQTHGGYPWRGVDPIVVTSQVVLSLQTIVSRQIDITLEPAILSFGAIHGGVRSNIIPETVSLTGTMRTFNEDMRKDMRERIKNTAEKIAESCGAKACVHIDPDYDVTYNDPALTRAMLPTLQRVAGVEKVFEAQKIMGSEDFSFFQKVVPGLFFLLGITPAAQKETAAANHSPLFYIDEASLVLGVRSLSHLAVDYLDMP